FSCADYLFVAENNHSFEQIASYKTQLSEISGVGKPRTSTITRITPSLFNVLEVSPSIGRQFTEQEDAAGNRLVVLGYGFARSAFGNPNTAIGQTIYLDRVPYTVVGVMPRSFSFPIRGAQFNSEP